VPDGADPGAAAKSSGRRKTITQRKPHQRVQAGIAYVPQGREIFPRLTVEENLLMGLSRPAAREAGQVPEEIYQLFPVLKTMKQRRGGDLSGGQQQQLLVARWPAGHNC
jgi:urea transport system ATP-binding protein